MFDLSVDLAKESTEYSTGDVLTLYGIIVAVLAVILIVSYKSATKK